ncbi:MAG TPA: recombination protein RecR, partial [Clostridiaceae bacterium]|nr:recombination protein RecR [Clostridiaceae bacterium]
MTEFETPYINELIYQLGQLPGIGKKTAQRLAFHLLSQA